MAANCFAKQCKTKNIQNFFPHLHENRSNTKSTLLNNKINLLGNKILTPYFTSPPPPTPPLPKPLVLLRRVSNLCYLKLTAFMLSCKYVSFNQIYSIKIIILQFLLLVLMWECARLRSERSGFEPWPGTLCCVLGQDTLLSQCLSPPRCINGYRRTQCWGVTLRWTSIPSRGE